MKAILTILKLFICMMALASISCSSCSSTVDIKTIKSNPRNYVGKVVTIEGQVKERFGVIIGSYFVLEDKTESIAVITSKGLPQVGETVQVSGEVQYVTLGTTDMIALVEASENAK